MHWDQPERFANGGPRLCRAFSDADSSKPTSQRANQGMNSGDIEERCDSGDNLVKFSEEMRTHVLQFQFSRWQFFGAEFIL